MYFCITDPDLDASQVTIKQYLRPDLVNPHLPPNTLTLSPQSGANTCYIINTTITGPAGLWTTTLDVRDSNGNVSGPTVMLPDPFTVN